MVKVVDEGGKDRRSSVRQRITGDLVYLAMMRHFPNRISFGGILVGCLSNHLEKHAYFRSQRTMPGMDYIKASP